MRQGTEQRAGQTRTHLIDEEHGEILGVGADHLPSHGVGASRGPTVGIAGGEDEVGTGGGDKGNQGEEERPHVKVEGSRREKKKWWAKSTRG